MIRRWLPPIVLLLLMVFAWVEWRPVPAPPEAVPQAQGPAAAAPKTGASVEPVASVKPGGVALPGLAAFEEETTRLVDSVVPSVVSITTQKRIRQRVPVVVDAFDLLFGPRQQRVVEQTETGLGSGVIVSSDGHILTNHHVIQGMEEIRVQLTDGRIEPAELIGSDPQTDIALLKIKGPVPALPFADSDKVRVGQPVLAVGNPFGLQETVTQGIISAKGRALQDSGVGYLQTDAAVNQGNSGGPLLNFRGEVIGINSAIYSAKTGTWLGISFAIPSNVARASMESILRTGKVQRQTLGVATMALTPQLARQLGMRAPVGGLVTQVQPGSPAERAGLQPGDVIAGLDGKIVQTPADLQRALAAKRPGSSVQLLVVRDGREFRVQAEVAVAAER